VQSAGTPQADEELAEFRELERHRCSARFTTTTRGSLRFSSRGAHADPAARSRDSGPQLRAHAAPNQYEGVGYLEAPRGTLIHHYKIDQNG